MNYKKNIFVLVFFIVLTTSNALYPSNYDQRHGQSQDQDQSQQQASTNLNIILPKMIIEDFEYVPTVQGYRFSYNLQGGSAREEIAFITGNRMDESSRLDSKNTDLNAVGVGGRPRMKLKNRKLSPGSLKSLSG